MAENKIKGRRCSLGITQQQAADFLNVSRGTYIRKERERNFTQQQLNRLCELFKCTTNDLV